jgi:hypothetical protein
MIRSPLALAALAAALLAPLAPLASAAELTDADVGDAASFAEPVKWLGLVSGFVELDTDCSPATPTDPPRTNCIVLNPAPAITSFDRPDLAKITLPGRSAKSLICHWQTPIASVFWQNTTATTGNARISIRPYYRIESEVLTDPTLINPQTGLPFAGGFESSLTAVNESQPLAAGQTQNRFYTFTRACIGGLVSRNFLTQTLGLTDAQATQLFRKPITVRAGLRGNAQLVQFATINVGTRFVGD